MDKDDDLPILKDEVINNIKSLKDGKLPGNDNISSELLKHGGDAIVNVFTELCQKSWSEEMASTMDSIFSYTNPQER